jgi:dTDP-4-amino-4,6-dideoxygalactose transaminase
MQVPLLDLREQFAPLRAEILGRIAEIADRQEFVLGPAVESCEAAVAAYCGAPHAIGVASGTDAILAVLMALEIGPGDAVITTPYTFFATAGCVHRVGAEPVFCDIDPATFNLDPGALADLIDHRLDRAADGSLRTRSGNRVRAILPVHLFGLCCDLEAVARIACEHRLPMIEDAAQAIGAEYRDAAGARFRAGAYGEAGCFSFYPTKNLGGFGDGGLVTCREAALARTLRILRNHGMEERYLHHMIGGNFRLDAIQAAVVEIKLRHLDGWSAARRAHAATYRRLLAAHRLGDAITLPAEPWADRGLINHHIYNQYVIRTRERDRLQAFLRERGVGTGIYYPLPLHLQPCFATLGHKAGDFPESERAARETLALPIYPELREDQIAHVADSVAAFFQMGS